MASRRVRLRYWSVDIRQFLFWFTVAFVAGAGPNLAELAHPAALVGLSVAAGGVALLFWYRDHRKKGIGVYIHLTRTNPGPGPDQAVILASVRSWMEKHHRDWFRAGPDLPYEETDKRVNGMLASIRHRLDEVESWASGTPPLFLYVQCGLSEAFALGRQMAHAWSFHQLASLEQEPAAWAIPPIDWHIRAMSHHSPGKPYHLDLAKALTAAPGSGNDLVHADVGALSPGIADGRRPRSHRLAVLVYAASDSPDQEGLHAFIKAAEEAAGGGAASGYMVAHDDICDRSLIIRVPVDPLLKALGDETGLPAASFVSAIRDHWHRFARQRYGTTDVPVRLFLLGPSILAFALAALFPRSSRLVPWVSAPIEPDDDEEAMSEIVAIVDGDDVGAGMESQLLGRSLDKAIEYSRKMQSAMTILASRVTAVPGVVLLSTGGDSAIFTLPRASLHLFEHALDVTREDLDYRFSCGYGEDSREAFIALRAAKTGGKNVTVGSG